MLWLAAYLTGFPPFGLHALSWTHGLAPMWSGLYLISTEKRFIPEMGLWSACQCPLGLIPHFYFTPDGKYIEWTGTYCVNALSGLYLISTWIYGFTSLSFFFVSMPSRAYTSFLRYPFKNLGFMRFPEPVFAGIYQNILTTAVFRAC